MTKHRRTRNLAIVAALIGLASLAWAGYAVLGPSANDRQLKDLEGKGRGEIAMPTSTPEPTSAPTPTQRPDHHHDPDVTGAGHTVVTPNYPRDDEPAEPSPPEGSGPVADDFTVIVGSLRNLYPGSASALPVTYVNPNTFPISIDQVTVSAANSPGCPAAAFVAGQHQLANPVVVPSRGITTSDVSFGMRKSAPDGCQLARVAVTVTASARQATS